MPSYWKVPMHDVIRLSYIGLTDLEVKVLKSIFTLAPQLNENYSLLLPTQVDIADLVLVNIDDAESVRLWSDLKHGNQLVASLLLTDNSDLSGKENTIQRPIRIQKLIAALEEIVDQTSIDLDESDAIQKLRILVVDDSYPVRKYMEHKLTELIKTPIDIHFASSGEEAIERDARIDYKLIFLDVMMEGMDGYKACKQIKARGNSYIVMLTSKKSPFDKVRGTMSGCDAYVTKPPTDKRLVEVLQKYLGKCSELKNLPVIAETI